MNKKTLELLLINYQNIYKGMTKECAEKEKFKKLIADVELKLKHYISYPDGMTVLEYAIKLAHDTNLRNNKGVK